MGDGMAMSARSRAPRNRFDFGRNWEDFSLQVLDEDRLAEAQRSLEALLGADALRGRRFLDVGCGTGMFTIAAARLGASEAVGLDVDARCVAVARRNAERFGAAGPALRFVEASVLDGEALARLGRFDVVYAWGSLHHTGRMYEAMDRAAAGAAPGGVLALAIYNRHVTSPAWHGVKRFYQALGPGARQLMAGTFAVILFAAKLLVTRRNPLKKRRGMSFMVDVVDWVGGYPYEYASREEVESHLRASGFTPERFVAAPVPTGCNEYVFRAPGGQRDGK